MKIRNIMVSRFQGFTLIELLVVIAIIGMLMGMLFPAVTKARLHARKTAAKAEMKSIEMGLDRYYSEYKCWPDVFGGRNPEVDKARVELNLDQVLRGGNPIPDNPSLPPTNPKKFMFVDLKKRNKDNLPVSPLGTNYWVKLDTDFDNKIRPGRFGPPADPPDKEVNRNVIVWTAVDPPECSQIITSWE